jgi:hypothetical protein
MTTSKWILFFAFLWVIGLLASWTNDGQLFWGIGHIESPQVTMSNLTGAEAAGQNLPIVGNVAFLKPVTNFFSSLYNMITADFSFFHPYPPAYWIWACFRIVAVLTVFSIFWGAISGNITWG